MHCSPKDVRKQSAFGQRLLLDLTRNDLQQVNSTSSQHTTVHIVQRFCYFTYGSGAPQPRRGNICNVQEPLD